MDTQKLLQELRQEHAELGQAIRVLERRNGTSSGSTKVETRGRRVWTAAQKKALSLAAKKRWKEKKAKA